MENEVWKDIPDYEGLYQVSNLGRIKSLNFNKTGKEKIMKPRTGNRYYMIALWKYADEEYLKRNCNKKLTF